MEQTKFKINGKEYVVGKDVDASMRLVEFIRRMAKLVGTKYMCLEAGCGACIVSVVKTPGAAPEAINSCMVTVFSCHNWEITTIEKVGNRLDGYHPIQKTLAKHNGTQCGHCSPGWVMAMYSLMESKKDLTMHEIENSFSGNICRCTGYRPILDAFKSFAKDAPKSMRIDDIEDLRICKKNGRTCNKSSCDDDDEDDDWCLVSGNDVEDTGVTKMLLDDGTDWYRVQKVNDIFSILKVNSLKDYMLVAGNTAKGVYPIIDYPRLMIDISNVTELKGYTIDQNLVIGAGTTLSELLNIFEKLSQTENNFKYLKTFHEHLSLVATTAVRNSGSIAGNLMIKHQHNEFPSDVYLLLTTVNAQITIMCNEKIKQKVSTEQFLHINMSGKVILNIILPPLNDDYKVVTYKIMPRAQNAHAIVNAGFLYKYKTDNNVVLESRIAYGGLSPLFTRAKSAENSLIGKVLFRNETLQSTLKILGVELVVQENPPEPSAAYRRRLALALFYKSLLYLSPTGNVNARLRSGANKLYLSRPVSQASHTFDSKPSLYPLTQPIEKVEGLIQCAGEASYTDDKPACTEEVFAALVISTVPTGNIISIDSTNAMKQPGAIAFYSAKDIPGLNSFTPSDDPFGKINEEVFASDKIKYFNQPIGVVVATTKHIAEKIATMIDVKYANVRKPVIDIREAKKDPTRNKLFDQIASKDRGNDIKKTIKGSISGDGQIHMTMETIAILSRPTEEGLEVFATSQWLDALQTMVSRALNIQQNKVDVYIRRLGGAFGLKISRTTLSAVACSLVTWKLNKPCRLIMPLTHVTRALGKRFPFSSDYEMAVNATGAIQFMNLNVYEGNGYTENEQLQILAVRNYSNCYDGSRWNYKNISTMTDTAKNTWFRAPGHFESVATAEGIMERISYEMSLDPLEVRLANLEKSQVPDILEIVKTIKGSSQFDDRKINVLKFNTENKWKKRGLGISLLHWLNEYPRNFNVILSVFKSDGSIIVTHGGVEAGQGINTKVVQICAYLLKVPLDKIQVKGHSTTTSPNAAVTGGSLTTKFITIGTYNCCIELLDRLKPIRAQMNNPTWEDLIKKAFSSDVDLQIQKYVGQKYIPDANIYGMTVAEVEIDILTGEKQVLRVDILADAGQSPSPEMDLGQVEGAFIQGMGFWLTEEMVYDPNNGELLTNRTWNYHVPQALDIPQDIRVTLRKNSYNKQVPLGAKGISEAPICMAVAVPHAIRQALVSARLDAGIPTTTWFNIDGTYTLEKVCMASGANVSDFVFN